MRKFLIASTLFLSAGILNANPGKGGYLGHQFIIGVEGAYSPFYTSAKDFFTKYNFQYGGSFGVITGRRTQLNLNYNMWSLRGNELYQSNFIPEDRVDGSSFGLSLKTFRKKRGGIAPIGKFYDIGLSWATNKFLTGGYHSQSVMGDQYEFDFKSSQLLVHLSYGTQMVFWNRVVGNTGVRFGTPLYEFSAASDEYPTFMLKRMRMKEAFSVFFGVGVLL